MPRISDTSGPHSHFGKIPDDNSLPGVSDFKLPAHCPKSVPVSPESGINTILKIGGIETLPAAKAQELFILTIGEVIRRQREIQE